MPKLCRHVSCLSERRISLASLLGPGDGWVCLVCFREWEGKSKFATHGRTKNHPLAWVVPEERLFCVPCGEYVTMDSLNAKQKDSVTACISAAKALVLRKDASPVVVAEEAKEVDSFSTKESSLKAIISSPPGLHNLGNTCFMNSALQSLAVISTFVRTDEDEFGPLGNALFDLLSTLRTPTESISTIKRKRGGTTSAVNPSYFFDCLAQKYDFFERNEQQDSHDFLRLLFNALDDEFEGKRRKGTNSSVPPQKKAFGGSVMVKVDCKRCHCKSTKKEACLDVSLALSSSFDLDTVIESMTINENDHRHLPSLLDAWQRPQKLEDENAFACENCFKRGFEGKRDENHKVVYSPASCQYSFEEVPSCLIIHLQRFSITKCGGGRRKRSMSFGYGKDHREVKLSKFLTIGDATFAIKAMIIHEGSTAESGHYISFVNREDRWFRISDSSVTAITEATVLACGHAYIIFYERAAKISEDNLED